MEKSRNTHAFYEDWDKYKDDHTVWRRFWALWELRRKWNWADWFYQKLDRANGEVVETEAWSITPGQGYMKLCLWIALLRSVHEGITKSLDPFNVPRSDIVHPKKVLPAIPLSIEHFPAIPGSPFRDFRNAIFHCQWSPTLAKFKLDQNLTKKVDQLHKDIGDWLTTEFQNAYKIFDEKYGVPTDLIYDKAGNEWMPESFY